MLSACSTQAPETSVSSAPEQSSAATGESTGSESTADASGSGQPTESTGSSDQGSSDESKNGDGATSSDSTPRCSADDLKTTVDQGDSSAGQLHFTVTFANTSDDACTLDGHPGVSAVGDHDGTQIGDSATREGKAGKAVVLIPNAHATADIQAVNIGDDGGPLGDSCNATKADGWRIYPPGSKTSIYVEQDGLKVCADKDADWLSVSVVKPVS